MGILIKKKGWMVITILVIPVLVTFFALGHGNEHGHVSAQIGQGEVSIEFHRPLAGGRDVLALIQPGIYWMMGADGATILTTEVDLMFGDTRVAKGEYTLSAHFHDSETWSLVVSKDSGRRGSKPQEIIAEVPGTLSKLNASVDQMSIELTGQGSKGTLVLEWGISRLSVDFAAA
ncbi:MAG: DUF2911 domain-containing protein [Acidobacteria bacterium]|nr:DUF2911 domain-containing protein [Acidobacteriota bacterium]